MLEKYEAPEVEFVEMEDADVVTASNCPEYDYGDVSKGNCAPPPLP